MSGDNPLKMILTAEAGLEGSWEFTGPVAVVVGRDKLAAIHPAEQEEAPGLSRHHALIELGNRRAVLRDLRSSTGTWLNGHLVGRRKMEEPAPVSGVPAKGDGVELADGDVINLGDTWFRVSISNLLTPEKASFRRGTHCPGCGQALPKSALTTLRAPDVLCDTCRPNPVSALKLLKAGLSRRISALNPLKGLRIDGILGRGATSAVFLVTRRKSEVKLALKVMPPAVSSNIWARKSFLREAALGRALRHRNVVRMYESGSYSGAYFVLMEYCSGGSAEEERTASSGKLSLERALSIILPVLDGLDFLHNARLASSGPDGPLGKSTVGMIHRDLKPANIFLGGEDGLIPKIADIGVAKYHSQGGSCNTRTGTVAGSPATMPRQQAMNFKHAGPEVDVWAAAASLFKLITGEYPRRFTTNRDPWQVVLNEKPRPVRDLLPDLPPHLAVVLDRALEDDPAIYYQSAAALKKDLLEAVELDDIFL